MQGSSSLASADDRDRPAPLEAGAGATPAVLWRRGTGGDGANDRPDLYWAPQSRCPVGEGVFAYSTNDKAEFAYEPFSPGQDFGPLDIARTVMYCRWVDALCTAHAGCNALVHIAPDSSDEEWANTTALCGAYLVLAEGATAEEAVRPFAGENLIPFRDCRGSDAPGSAISDEPEAEFELSLLDVLSGLEHARNRGWLDYHTFNVEDHSRLLRPEYGDMSWLLPCKALALASPWAESKDQNGLSVCTPTHLSTYLREHCVAMVVQCNRPELEEEGDRRRLLCYDARGFEEAGIRHLHLPFEDGGCPSVDILLSFIDAARAVGDDGFAVHCRSGLGRTATLIGAYAMQNHGFAARNFIGWARVMRPGTVHGSQQQYLCNLEAHLRPVPQRPLGSLSHPERLALLPRRELRFWALDSDIPASRTRPLHNVAIIDLVLEARGLRPPAAASAAHSPAISVSLPPADRPDESAANAAPPTAMTAEGTGNFSTATTTNWPVVPDLAEGLSPSIAEAGGNNSGVGDTLTHTPNWPDPPDFNDFARKAGSDGNGRKPAKDGSPGRIAIDTSNIGHSPLVTGNGTPNGQMGGKADVKDSWATIFANAHSSFNKPKASNTDGNVNVVAASTGPVKDSWATKFANEMLLRIAKDPSEDKSPAMVGIAGALRYMDMADALSPNNKDKSQQQQQQQQQQVLLNGLLSEERVWTNLDRYIHLVQLMHKEGGPSLGNTGQPAMSPQPSGELVAGKETSVAGHLRAARLSAAREAEQRDAELREAIAQHREMELQNEMLRLKIRQGREDRISDARWLNKDAPSHEERLNAERSSSQFRHDALLGSGSLPNRQMDHLDRLKMNLADARTMSGRRDMGIQEHRESLFAQLERQQWQNAKGLEVMRASDVGTTVSSTLYGSSRVGSGYVGSSNTTLGGILESKLASGALNASSSGGTTNDIGSASLRNDAPWESARRSIEQLRDRFSLAVQQARKNI